MALEYRVIYHTIFIGTLNLTHYLAMQFLGFCWSKTRQSLSAKLDYSSPCLSDKYIQELVCIRNTP